MRAASRREKPPKTCAFQTLLRQPESCLKDLGILTDPSEGVKAKLVGYLAPVGRYGISRSARPVGELHCNT
jgi:hypothetical protein